MKKILIIFILFLSTTTLSANDRNLELDKLFLELKKNIPSLSSRIAQQIWTLWSTHPTDQKLTSILDEGSRLVQDRQLNRAIDVFTEAIELDPKWAEAWNKRATVLFFLGEFERAKLDIAKTLELENNHFGALAGLGMVEIHLGNPKAALRAYRRATLINPHLQDVKQAILRLEKELKGLPT